MIRSITSLAAAALMMLALTGCSTLPQSINSAGQVQHVVICWLKPGADRAALIRASGELTAIPGVLDVAVGGKLAGNRPMVDNTFDIAIVVTFTDEQALRDYDQHPLHKRLTETVLKPNVDKVLIYDALLENYSISEAVNESTLKRRAEAMKAQREIVERRRQ